MIVRLYYANQEAPVKVMHDGRSKHVFIAAHNTLLIQEFLEPWRGLVAFSQDMAVTNNTCVRYDLPADRVRAFFDLSQTLTQP